MKRELSGSRVIVLPFVTYKSGEIDVRLQGWNMQRAHVWIPSVAPKIYKVFGKRYLMETLRPLQPPLDIDLLESQLKKIWCLNESAIYRRQPRFSAYTLISFLTRYNSPIAGYVRSNAQELGDLYRSSAEATHGDLTIDNVMIGRDGGYRFIDWQPFRRKFIPAHRDVDYGKLVQSYLGWPGMNNPSPPGSLNPALRIMDEHPYAWLWACVHYERIKLRLHNEAHKQMCDGLISMIISMQRSLTEISGINSIQRY